MVGVEDAAAQEPAALDPVWLTVADFEEHPGEAYCICDRIDTATFIAVDDPGRHRSYMCPLGGKSQQYL